MKDIMAKNNIKKLYPNTQQKILKLINKLIIFNQWIAGKQVFQITIVCDHEHRFVGQLGSQRSVADLKRGNVTSTPQPFTFGRQFPVVQAQNLINEDFCFPRQVHRFWS